MSDKKEHILQCPKCLRACGDCRCGDPVDLPSGYKERMDVIVLRLMPLAERAMDLGAEFGGDNVLIHADGLRLRIDRQEK